MNADGVMSVADGILFLHGGTAVLHPSTVICGGGTPGELGSALHGAGGTPDELPAGGCIGGGGGGLSAFPLLPPRGSAGGGGTPDELPAGIADGGSCIGGGGTPGSPNIAGGGGGPIARAGYGTDGGGGTSGAAWSAIARKARKASFSLASERRTSWAAAGPACGLACGWSRGRAFAGTGCSESDSCGFPCNIGGETGTARTRGHAGIARCWRAALAVRRSSSWILAAGSQSCCLCASQTCHCGHSIRACGWYTMYASTYTCVCTYSMRYTAEYIMHCHAGHCLVLHTVHTA